MIRIIFTIAITNEIGYKSLSFRKERQKWFLSLLCGTCLIYATRTSVPLLIPVVSQEKNWSKSDSGIILSSFFWGYTLTQVASGYISDKIGGQRVLWISALGWSATTFLMPEIIEFFSGDGTSILLVAAVRMINGAFQGNFQVFTAVLLAMEDNMTLVTYRNAFS